MNNITIAILTYNRPDYLETSLRSALAQTVLPDEVLIIDDGSTPETREVVEAFHSPLIRYIWKENGGHSCARNRAVRELRTKYLLWLDDDDALLPHAVEAQLKSAIKNPQAQVIYGRLILSSSQLEPVAPMPVHELNAENYLLKFFKHNPIPNPGTLIRKDAFEIVGPFDSRYRYAEDYDFYCRAASKRIRFAYSGADICYYRAHANNLATRQKQLKSDHERAQIVGEFISREKVEEIFTDLPWESEPEKAYLRACHHMGRLFARLGDYSTALEALENAHHLFPKLVNSLQQLVIAYDRNGAEGIWAQRKLDALMRFEAESLMCDLLSRDFEPEEQDQFRARLTKFQIDFFGLEQLYPSAPWKDRPHDAVLEARFQLLLKYAEFGAFDEIKELFHGIPFDWAKRFLGLLDDYRASRPLNFTEEELQNPLFRIFRDTLANRTERYQTIEQERRLTIPETTGITVAIITYNRPEYIAEAVKSATQQTCAPDEILIIDDGSDESCKEQLKKIAKLSRLIRVVTQDNAGRPAARNTAVQNCKSRFLVWLDDDDTLAPETLERYSELIASKPDTDVIYANLLLCNEKMQPLREERKEALPSENTMARFIQTVPVPNGGTAIRTELFFRIGNYDLELDRAQDYDFFARACSAGANFQYLDFVCCNYRSHQDNLAADKGQYHSYRARVVEKMLERHSTRELFPQFNWEDIPDVAELLAHFEIAVLYIKCGALQKASSALRRGTTPVNKELMDHYIAIIEHFREDGIAGLRKLFDDVNFYSEKAIFLTDAVLAEGVTPLERDNFTKERVRYRLRHLRLEDIYFSLDWSGNFEDSYYMATVDTLRRLIAAGLMEEAIKLCRESNVRDRSELLEIEKLLRDPSRCSSVAHSPHLESIVEALETRQKLEAELGQSVSNPGASWNPCIQPTKDALGLLG